MQALKQRHFQTLVCILAFQRLHYAETVSAVEDTCLHAPLNMESLCPDTLSEKTSNYVQLKPKFIPRDHPHYDVMIPEDAREKTNLYCGHPDCEPNPCQNGGTCLETLEDFTCECPGSFVGKRCEMECDAVYPGSVSSAGSCYLFSAQDQQTWEVARDRCDELGGHLVTIETSGKLMTIQNDILLSLYGVPPTDKVWTGLSDTSSEGVYEWEGTGETLPISSSLWDPGQPRADTAEEQDCIFLRTYSLRDTYCYNEFSYLCEFGPWT
ncbi:brevican core protein-like [Diadema setosum]|uniref:brevican core protein-like n=1 Tax=Diadema setosum TaxID=31175 RepID=UPI003B3AEDEA